MPLNKQTITVFIVLQEIEGSDVLHIVTLLSIVQDNAGQATVVGQGSESFNAFKKIRREGGGRFDFHGPEFPAFSDKQIHLVAVCVSEKEQIRSYPLVEIRLEYFEND